MRGVRWPIGLLSGKSHERGQLACQANNPVDWAENDEPKRLISAEKSVGLVSW